MTESGLPHFENLQIHFQQRIHPFLSTKFIPSPYLTAHSSLFSSFETPPTALPFPLNSVEHTLMMAYKQRAGQGTLIWTG